MQKNPDKIHRNDGAYFRNRSSHPADLDCLKWGTLYVSFYFMWKNHNNEHTKAIICFNRRRNCQFMLTLLKEDEEIPNNLLILQVYRSH